MTLYDILGAALAGLGALIAGFSWSRRSTFGMLVGIILVTVGWFELFIF